MLERLPSDADVLAAVASVEADVIVFPGWAGQYDTEATNVVAVLDEAGVSAEYASDPMTAGVFEHRSADILLPALLIGELGNIMSTIDGLVFLMRYYLDRHNNRAHVRLAVGRIKRPKETVEWVELEIDGGVDVEAVIRESIKPLLDDASAD